MDRITAIRKSLSAFACGLVGLVPVIAFVPVVCALGAWACEEKRPPAAEVCAPLSVLLAIEFALAIYALVWWGRIRSQFRNQWNPASAYLGWGALLALTGMLVSALMVAAAVLTLAH